MKALVLSGGGSRGAFQVGALKRLVVNEGHTYDILCGTSVGALNASFLAQYKKEDQARGVFDLTSLWLGIKQSDVYTNWPVLGMAIGIFKKGLYNAGNLKKLIKKNIDPKKIVARAVEGTKLRLTAASLTTGQLEVFTEQTASILDAVYASAAFPVMFEPIKIGNQWYSDGGLRDISPLAQAIRAGATEIHIINCSNVEIGAQKVDSSRSLDILLRSVDIMTNEILINDVQTMLDINELVRTLKIAEKRYIDYKLLQPHPSTKLSDSLTFDHKEIIEMISAGLWDTEQYRTNF